MVGRLLCWVTVAAVSIILLTGPAQAHIGSRIYLIPELSDADAARVDLRDGSIADWEAVLGVPLVQAADFHSFRPPNWEQIDAEGYNPSDLDYRIWLSWQPSTNRVYFGAQRTDNVYFSYSGTKDHILTEGWQYDYIEFMIDGDHSGGDYTGSADPAWSPEEQSLNSNRTAQQYLMHAAPGMFNYNGSATWVVNPPFADGGGASVGSSPATSVYEYYVTPFDELVKTSAAQSVISPLFPDKIIGFQISMPDFDHTPGNYDGWHQLSGEIATWRFADRFVDGRLIASAGSGNQAPVLAAIGSRSATTGVPLQIDLAATDADGDPLTFRLSNPPARGVLAGSTFTWTPGSTQAGTYHLLFTVTDGRGGVDSESVVVTVIPAQAHIGDRIYLIPEFSDADIAALDLRDGSIADWEATAGLPLVQTTDFHSAGPGWAGYDPVNLDYRIWLGWHHGTNRLYFGAQRIDDVYLEYPGPVEQAATEAWRYDEIELMIDGDHSGGDYTGSANPTWSPEEQSLNNNRTAQQFVLHAAPGMFNYMGGTAWPTQPPFGDGGGASVGNGPTTSVYEYYVTPFDDLVKTSAAQSVISPLFPDKIIGFQISMPDYDTTPGTYDGWHTLSGQDATWRFADRFVDGRLIADAGTGNTPPVLGSIGPRSATTGVELRIDLAATDADGDPLTFHLSNPPVGGVLTASTFTWTPSSSEAATYHLLFTVTDGKGGVDSESVVVTVARVNHAPVLAAIGAQTVAEGTALSLALSGSDPDSDPLTYSVSGNPAGSQLSGSTFTWTPGYSQAGAYAVAFAVSDGKGGVASETVTITVNEGSASPSPIKPDLNPTTGDQGVRERHAPAGSDLVLQLVYTGSEPLRGYGALLTYDAGRVRLPAEEFAATQAGWLPVTRSLVAGQLEVGAVVLTGTLGQADLGTLHIHVDSPLAADAEVILSRVVLRLADGREQQIQVDERVTIRAGGMAGDFNFDGTIDFSDFFLFADAFASPVYDPLYDLDNSGTIDFSDFFQFADLFARPQQGKLMALAHQYLGLPEKPGLESAYPNPFNASTTIRYRLSSSGPTRLEIFALTGQRVATLVDEPQSPGSHLVSWDGRADDGQAVATGIYLVRLESLAGTQVLKISLLR